MKRLHFIYLFLLTSRCVSALELKECESLGGSTNVVTFNGQATKLSAVSEKGGSDWLLDLRISTEKIELKEYSRPGGNTEFETQYSTYDIAYQDSNSIYGIKHPDTNGLTKSGQFLFIDINGSIIHLSTVHPAKKNVVNPTSVQLSVVFSCE
ncbi:hypothetical protein O5O45_19440 [Hahella aquimaris]|uniref:hypothetical protein n=1 Tax=Hahella sp. HNIBRBA332 TaxID=3015983 RepID=UPI00273C6577|nr:hypothetical protein [Hahella sp. HNIBRBA332]WLQ11905.1 hypothetical protein O5O45_19440 [Hahella sp. HNIBRBA332]